MHYRKIYRSSLISRRFLSGFSSLYCFSRAGTRHQRPPHSVPLRRVGKAWCKLKIKRKRFHRISTQNLYSFTPCVKEFWMKEKQVAGTCRIDDQRITTFETPYRNPKPYSLQLTPHFFLTERSGEVAGMPSKQSPSRSPSACRPQPACHCSRPPVLRSSLALEPTGRAAHQMWR